VHRVNEALADELACRIRARRAPTLIGIAGAQGSGKSTLAARLETLLQERAGLRAAVLSLDDLYLTRAERLQLARDVHPLLRTRGVPGTHDVALGVRTIEALLGARAGEVVRRPRFDKALDDRVPEAEWPSVVGPIDALLLEGWCVGATAQGAAALAEPCNELEREHDRDARFRRHVDDQLAGPYRALFERLDAWVYLQVPDLDCARAWRREQEIALRAVAPSHAQGVMDDAELTRFSQYFERISRDMLRQAPGRADIVLRLARNHTVDAMLVREPCAAGAPRDFVLHGAG
jgi:D-glycerate 3-kinase